MLQPIILYEDDDVLVLEKPSGMTVNKADTTKDEITLQDWVEKQFQISSDYEKSREIHSDNLEKNKSEFEDPAITFKNRAGIVHRLDKETSGIILVSKNVETFIGLQKQFKERTTQKKYIALVHGKIVPQDGNISVPIGRLQFNRKRFGVVAGGREAVTVYKTIENIEIKTKYKNEWYSLLELYPKTGRTHQIRVHLKYLNHPIFSDELYAGRKTARDDRKLLPRLFLHASSIGFIHPKTGKELKIENLLPNELQNLLETFKGKSC